MAEQLSLQGIDCPTTIKVGLAKPAWLQPGAHKRARGHRHHFVILTCPCCNTLIISRNRVPHTWLALKNWLRRATQVQLVFSKKTKRQIMYLRPQAKEVK